MGRDSKASLEKSGEDVIGTYCNQNYGRVLSRGSKSNPRGSDVESRESVDDLLHGDLGVLGGGRLAGGTQHTKSLLVVSSADMGQGRKREGAGPPAVGPPVEPPGVHFDALAALAAQRAPIDQLSPHLADLFKDQENLISARARGMTVHVQKSGAEVPDALFLRIEGDQISHARSLRHNTIKMHKAGKFRLLNYDAKEKDTLMKSLVGFKGRRNSNHGSPLLRTDLGSVSAKGKDFKTFKL